MLLLCCNIHVFQNLTHRNKVVLCIYPSRNISNYQTHQNMFLSVHTPQKNSHLTPASLTMLAEPKDSTTASLSIVCIKTSLKLLTLRFTACQMILESASLLLQKIIRFSVRTLLSFEMTVSLYEIYTI